jgi:hypothetical protein
VKWLLLLVVIGVGVFFGYPLVNEDASGECDALERAAVRLAFGPGDRRPQEQMLGQLFQGVSKGQFASVAVRHEYPNVPVTAACAMLYWRAIIDPNGFREQAGRLRS